MSHLKELSAVIGVVLNDTTSFEKIKDQLSSAPYNHVPKSPILYIKPKNTWVTSGHEIALPPDSETLEIGATLGLVMGAGASHLMEKNAMHAVEGVVLAVDFSVPHASYYRPAIREKCFDKSMGLGQVHLLPTDVDISQYVVHTQVNDELVESFALSDLIYTPAQLLVQVTEFMALAEKSVLLLGIRYKAARAKIGDEVRVYTSGGLGLGELHFSVVAQQKNSAA